MKYILIILFLITQININYSQNDENAVNYPVFLNKSENLGLATAFQSKDDPNSWYLLPNTLRIKRNEQGKLMFGFLKYVRNKRSGALNDEIERGAGGGVVYFTAGFNVSLEERKELLRELKRRKGSSSKIVGTIAYDSGDIEVVTFGIERKDEDKTEVLGTGSAPLMDGDAIAVNIILNDENATKLWKTFDEGKGNYGNLGLNLNMQIRGYHTPVSAKITMNTEDIMKNERVSAAANAGMSNSNMGVIMGAELDKITNDLINTGAIEIEQTGDIGEDFDEILKSATELFMENFLQPISIQDLNNMNNSLGGSSSPLDRATNLRNNQLQEAQERTKERRTEKINHYSNFADPFITSNNPGEIAEPRRTPPPPPPESEEERNAEIRRIQSSGQNYSESNANPSRANDESSESDNNEQIEEALNSDPMNIGISAYAGYFARNINMQKEYSLSLKKIRAVQRGRTITSSFPILPKDAFMQINLDDPLYKQREIVAMIDGFNAEDFGNFINYVTITMKKKHAGGDITTDEVRIDRKNFNSEGNKFKLMYGWGEGDNDRRNWLNYDYKVDWSFFGGGQVSEEWKSDYKGAISVAPPYQKYTLSLAGDKDYLKEQGVRLATVKIYYDLNGKEVSRIHTFNLMKDIVESDLQILLSPDLEYEYEIIWQLRGNKTIKSGRQKGSSLYLLFDELPN